MAKASKRRTWPSRLLAYALLAVAALLLSQVRNGPSVEVFGVDVALYWVAVGFYLLGAAASWAWSRSRG